MSAQAEQKVASGKVVTMRYTLTGEDGKVLDESGDEGMPYLHGAENIVPGLEKRMEGQALGDKFRVVVSPEEGYGKRLGKSQKVSRDAFPPGADIEIGMQFLAEGPGRKPIPLWIVGITPTEIELDGNHPLAGFILTFDVEILAIRSATAEELKHGHPHGADGHEHHHH